ncbi:MAG: MerR family transcriptional regulator [Muribaculaceae bacterium]|nr:MerR family transcriptional regulator [Muribaculaceae bacterium]MDE6315477.1 MerR family transcriptional regulator [Muribaculaceae bacterium]
MPASTIRYWETEFSQLTPKRNDRGTRYFTPADIEIIRQIKYLLHDRGLKIESAREQLSLATNTVESKQRALNRLRDIRARLVALHESLHKLR